MKEFLAALNRHHVSRVAAAYLLAAWFVIQLTNNLAPLLSLPLWLQRAILLIIVIGFPVTALFAWALQPASVGVEGKKLTTQADLALAVGLFAITGLIIYEQFAPMVGKLTLPNESGDLVRLGGLYLIAAFLICECGKAIPAPALPRGLERASAVLLVGGFPPFLAFAWFFHLHMPPRPAGMLMIQATNVSLGIALVFVAALVTYRGVKGQSNLRRNAQERGIEPVGTSVAVLPFVNLSGDVGQDFFSDGMTVEITMALANVPGLLVIGRASAFEFKGRSDWRVIGQQLGTTHLLQGTVQRGGDRVRITAELFRAADNFPLWRGQFDRVLHDIFSVQESIARAIAEALHVPLGLKQQNAVVRNRTKNVASYDSYLRAKGLIRARGLANLLSAAQLLEESVAADPDYAPSWAMLAYAYALRPSYDPLWHSGNVEAMRSVVTASLPTAETAARKAIALDAEAVYAYIALGFIDSARGHFTAAEGHFKSAIKFDPSNPEALHGHCVLLSGVGFLREAFALSQKVLELDPCVTIYKIGNAVHSWLLGDDAAATKILEDAPDDDAVRNFYLAHIYASVGRYAKAADAISAITIQHPLVSIAAGLMRLAPTSNPPQPLPTLGSFGFVYLYIGAADRFLEFFEGSLASGYLCFSIYWLWHPSYREVRNTERFQSFIKASGLLDYWLKRGFPASTVYEHRHSDALAS